MNEVKTAAEPLRLQISSPSTSCVLPKHPHFPGDPFRKIVLLDNTFLYMHKPHDLHLEITITHDLEDSFAKQMRDGHDGKV